MIASQSKAVRGLALAEKRHPIPHPRCFFFVETLKSSFLQQITKATYYKRVSTKSGKYFSIFFPIFAEHLYSVDELRLVTVCS